MTEPAKLATNLRRLFIVFASCALLLIAVGLPRISFDNDILALFPHAQHNPSITHADQLITERVTSKVFFLLHSDNWDATRTAAASFVTSLQQCECFLQASANHDLQALTQLQEKYREFAPVLLTDRQREELQAGSGPQRVQKSLRNYLVNPTTGMTESLRYDPLGTLQDFLNHTHPGQTNVQLDEQGFVAFGAPTERYLLIIAELSGSPYSVALQKQAQLAIATAEAEFNQLSGADIVRTGVLFYTLAGTTQARTEISTVGLGSALGILFLLLIVFRSPVLTLLAFMPIIFGVLLGLVVCNFIFGSVHIVALVFGASLVGVAIDYALHFFTHRHALGAQWQAASGLQHLLPALSLGLLSSVAAYLSFTLAGFPGFTQVAIFSCVGLVTAYSVVVGFYPWLLQRPAKRALPISLVTWIKAYHRWILHHLQKFYTWPVILPLAIFIALGLWQLTAQDDVRAMQLPEQQLLTMEQRFQALVGQRTALQYLLVSGADTEQLLQRLTKLRPELQHLQAQGTLGGFQSIIDYVPAATTQLANWQVWQRSLIETNLLADMLTQLGVRADFKTSVIAALNTSAPHLIQLEQMADTLNNLPDAPIFFNFANQQHGVVLLQGLTEPAALARLAEAHAGVEWVDAVAQTNQLLRDYRMGTALLLAFAYTLLVVVFSWRYSWRGALAIVAPPLLASALCFSLLGWFGQSVSVFNLMALLLVLGVGIDAALFMRESGAQNYATLLAIALSTLTTVLGFGLLSLSATAAIHSFGITILLGILLCFLLSPLALAVVPSANAVAKK